VHETVTQLAAPDEKGLTAGVNLRQSVSSLNTAAGNIADDSEALKHNFLLRGFFKKRGYYNLTNLAPDRYRNERLFVAHENERVWLAADELFQRDGSGAESLSPAGASLLERVFSRYGAKVLESAIVIEGYSDAPEVATRLVSSQNRSVIVRNRLRNTFQLDPETIGSVALENAPPKNAGRTTWNGVAIVIVPPK
jgi:phospholipid/cholesterol/gamma-HCH transport system substrate-binding protein